MVLFALFGGPLAAQEAGPYAPAGEYIKDHTIIRDLDGVWHCFSISGRAGTDWTNSGSEETFSHFVSLDLRDWRFLGHALEPSRRPADWNHAKIWAPHVILHDGTYYMFYTGVRRDNCHIESIGLATSDDLETWKEHPGNPVVECPEWGKANDNLKPCRDPMVFRDEPNKRWILYYTTYYDHETKKHAVGAAVSTDLLNWKDAGLMMREPNPDGPYSLSESCFVIRREGRYYAFLNHGVCVSDDPLSGWSKAVPYASNPRGFAGEVLRVGDRWVRSLVTGKSRNYLLALRTLEWKPDGGVDYSDFDGTAPSAPRGTGYVTAQGRNFWLDGKRHVPYGVYYQPSYAQPLFGERDWLTDYDRDAVIRDLDLMARAGLNTVRVMAGIAHRSHHRDRDWSSWPAPETSLRARLHDFLDLCGGRGIRAEIFFNYNSAGARGGPIHLFTMLADSSKRREALDAWRKFITECDLAGRREILSYEVDWEPHVGGEKQRNSRRGRELWSRWIVDTYGSADAARKRWAQEEGTLDPPTDAEMRADGPWTRKCAAYRRFLEDMVHKRQAFLRRTIREADPNHLVCSQRVYFGKAMDRAANCEYPLGNADHFLDYIGFTFSPAITWNPSGADWYSAHAKELMAEGYASAVAARGKPVIFDEYGRNVLWRRDPLPDEAFREEDQAEHIRRMHEIALDSGTSGVIAWWWQGRRPMHKYDGETSDWGILRPDGTPRPACEALRKNAGRFREAPPVHPSRFLAQDPYRRACEELVHEEGREAYAKMRGDGCVVEVRTPWHDATSATAAANEKPDALIPLAALNGLFYRAEVRGGGEWEEVWRGREAEVAGEGPVRLRVTLANTGDALWLARKFCGPDGAGAVRLALRVNDSGKLLDLRRDVPAAGSVSFDDLAVPRADLPARVSLRLRVEGAGEFGEKLEFLLKAAE